MEKTKTMIEIPSKVTITQYRKTGWVDGAPDGEYQYTNTATVLSVQRDKKTGILNTGLEKEDEIRLERALGLNTGTLSKTSSFWDQNKFNIRIGKGGITLSPKSSPMDEIKWRVMLVHTDIANSDKTKSDWAFSRYVMSSEEEAVKETNKTINTKLEAFKEFSSMSEQGYKDFLLAYGKRIDSNSSIDFLKSEVGKLVDTEPQAFLDLIKGSDYKYKIFLRKLIDKGLVRESGGKYTLIGGEVLGFSFGQAIDFLLDPKNQDSVVSLKGQLTAVK
jgi:hypothetical protein